jgi:hypothetical protein
MTIPPGLRELALNWLERNTQRNTLRSTPPETAFRDPGPFHGGETPKTHAPVEKHKRVPLFRALGNGTAEHPPPDAIEAERPAEHEAERWRHDFEERSAIREHDGGLSRVEAEASALADLAQQWRSENPLPASDRAACCHCGKPNPCTPVLARNGHAWMHARCWPPLNSAREKLAREAITMALGTAMAIAPKTTDAARGGGDASST